MATTAADILVRAVMTGSSGLPSDVFVNDFAFHFDAGGSPSNAQINSLFGAVDGFYRDVVYGTYKLADFIGEQVSRAVTHELQAYTITSGPMGSPRNTEPWLGPQAPIISDANLPSECAGVLSFHADLTGVAEESGASRPRARRRGRLFIGPLIIGAISADLDNPVLSVTFTATMRAAATHMFDEAQAAGFTWSVWSREDDTLRPVVAGWTDNAVDIQRRRGTEATLRTVYTTV